MQVYSLFVLHSPVARTRLYTHCSWSHICRSRIYDLMLWITDCLQNRIQMAGVDTNQKYRTYYYELGQPWRWAINDGVVSREKLLIRSWNLEALPWHINACVKTRADKTYDVFMIRIELDRISAKTTACAKTRADKAYDVFMIRIELDWISAKTQKHPLVTLNSSWPLCTAVAFWGKISLIASVSSPKRDCGSKTNLSSKIVVPDHGDIWWRHYCGYKKKIDISVIAQSIAHHKVWLKPIFLTWIKCNEKNVFTAMKRSILRFSIWNSNTVFVTPVQN